MGPQPQVDVGGGIAGTTSLAIGEYLGELFPEAGLWPKEAAARAHARAISNEMHAGVVELRQNLPMDLRRRWPELFAGRAQFRTFTPQSWVAWVRAQDKRGQWRLWHEYIGDRYGY